MKPSTVVRATAFLLLAMVSNAAAQAQTSDQQRCFNKSSGSARKVATSMIRNGADCLKLAAAGKLDGITAQDCLTADLKGKVGKARAKVDGQVMKNCGGAKDPSFGFTDATTINDAHEEEGGYVAPDSFGLDLDAALAGPLAGDAKARCTSGAIGQAAKVADAMLKTYLGCVKSGLKEATIDSEAGLVACLDEIVSDPRQRVAKAVSRVESKLVSGCPATPADFFPELDGPGELCDDYGLALPLNANTLSTCLRNRLRCRVCRIVNASSGLDESCDQFDDGVIDGTCPECPNGATDIGEECDDGNLVDGDGCTSQCILEFCGDGIVNNAGTEQCDDGENNSDTEPGACRTDCTFAGCGDGIVDEGEDCDGGGVATDTCDIDCTFAVCGDGDVNAAAGEECDDSNTAFNDACVSCQNAECGDGFVRTGFEQCDSAECCTGACTFATAGTACTGTEDICTSPQCNASGVCLESPANEGQPCDDDNVCTISSVCTAGDCAPDEWAGVGMACEWAVVGGPTNDTRALTNIGGTLVGGNICALRAEISASSSISGDIITSHNDGGVGAQFGANVTVGGDIITDQYSVTSSSSPALPGLVGVTTILPNQHVNKNPAPTFYDTFGNDPRITDCEAAQAEIAVTKAALDGLSTTVNYGSTFQDLVANPPAINAVNVGGVNVFDMTYLNGTASGITITLNGGGNPNTVFVLRIATRMNTGPNWTFNLTNGLTADHLLFYVSRTTASSTEQCALGTGNVGGGTLFCPRVWVNMNDGTQWSGAAYGGASALNGQVRLGQGTVLTYVPFTAALP